jgi:hypothetical protein
MIFLAKVILIIALLVRGAYNMKKGQPLSNHSTSVSEVDSDERHCREADYQQPDILDVNKAFICDQLMLHLYALY